MIYKIIIANRTNNIITIDDPIYIYRTDSITSILIIHWKVYSVLDVGDDLCDKLSEDSSIVPDNLSYITVSDDDDNEYYGAYNQTIHQILTNKRLSHNIAAVIFNDSEHLKHIEDIFKLIGDNLISVNKILSKNGKICGRLFELKPKTRIINKQTILRNLSHLHNKNIIVSPIQDLWPHNWEICMCLPAFVPGFNERRNEIWAIIDKIHCPMISLLLDEKFLANKSFQGDFLSILKLASIYDIICTDNTINFDPLIKNVTDNPFEYPIDYLLSKK